MEATKTVSKKEQFLSTTDADIDEYLLRHSNVNFKERLRPSKETDIVCESEELDEKLLGIEEKYTKLPNGEKYDEGKIYVWDKHGIVIPDHYFFNPNKKPNDNNPNNKNSNIQVVGYDKFGNPLFADKTLVGYDRRGLPIYVDKIIVDYDRRGNPIFASTKSGKYAGIVLPNHKTPLSTYDDTFRDPKERMSKKTKSKK